MVREGCNRLRLVGAWLAVVAAAAVVAGCQSPFQMHYEVDDFPPGRYAPSSREQTAENIFWGTLYIASQMFGCGDDD